MTGKYRILIAESQALLRAGLRALLESEPDMEIVGESDDSLQALIMIADLHPHLILVGISMPASADLDAVATIRKRFPTLNILIISQHKSDEYTRDALRSGALGYILTTASLDELRLAIRSVGCGKSYLSGDISDRVISGYSGAGPGGTSGTRWDLLTKREREILQLVAQGSGNRHIAVHLQLSIKTVEKHRSNLMRKLGMRNASMLTAYAMGRGLVLFEQ